MSAAEIVRRPVPVAGPGVVSVLYVSVKMFGLFYRRISIHSQEVHSPLRGSAAFTMRFPLQGGIPPCNKSLRVTWGGIPPQGEALFGLLLLGGIPPRSQSISIIIAGAVCHPGDRKRREEFPRRFKDVYSPSGPESPWCKMLRRQKEVCSFVLILALKRAGVNYKEVKKRVRLWLW